MNQTIKKLFAAGMAVIISVALIVTITYAWTTLSSAPVAEGIQISIGGGNTILLAPDVSEENGGKICHYPGYFKDTLVFSKFKSYDYLKQVDSLSPVSTADGLNFFIPSYYDISDEEVKNGEAGVGELKTIDKFEKDNELLFANLEKGAAQKGHYIYLDFWVVSPGTDYTLRVSKGDDNGGSYLIELPKVKESEDGFVLEETDGSFAAASRIGFLANTNYVTDASLELYKNSRSYDSRFKRLAGAYQEKGDYAYSGDNRFTIYEPNGDLNLTGENRRYVTTTPVGLNGNTVSLVDVSDRLTVQLKNSWAEKQDDNVTLSEMLAVSLAGKNIKTAKEAETTLYDAYLQGQFAPYVSRGEFILSTSALYSKCADDGEANELELTSLETAGATEDRYIVKLEKNVPQRIRMYVWIEGQDADCTAMTEAGRFALGLELAGSNKDSYEEATK